MSEFVPIYMHRFENNSAICKEFSIPESELKNCNVLLAYYHVGSWGCDSSAFVLFERDGVLYEVHGSHCSCYGLEGQWEPEETSVESLEHRAQHGSLGSVGGYDEKGYADESLAVIEQLKKGIKK